MADFPHCDDLVLHRPGTCWACDLYPEQQGVREQLGVNFTGEHDPSKHPCPAELRRPIDTINHWYNNTARTKEQADADAAEYHRVLHKAFADAGLDFPEELNSDAVT